MMRIGVMGLGIVGFTTAVNFAMEGHQVVGVDINEEIVREIGRGDLGRYPCMAMPHFDPSCLSVGADERDLFTTDVVFICVGTPSRRGGSVSTSYIERALDSLDGIGYGGIRVLRSTVLPSELDKNDLWLKLHAVNPEFLRERHAFSDFRDPPFVLIGTRKALYNSEVVAKKISDLYGFIRAPIVVTGAREALLAKYVTNAFHSVKVEFANEVGDLAGEQGCDGQRGMEILAQDTKLSISSNYLFPGGPFEGMCLPKDLLALLSSELDLPLLRGCWDGNLQRGASR